MFTIVYYVVFGKKKWIFICGYENMFKKDEKIQDRRVYLSFHLLGIVEGGLEEAADT